MAGSGVRLQILGPLRAWRDDAELDIGPRQQACLLAALAARAGHPVSMDRLIELIWADASPASAVNTVHKYVGALRRLLEPSVRPRGAGSYVRRRGNGYQFECGPGELDVVAFRAAVQAGRAELAQGRDEAALDHYAEATARWHGPAGEGLDCRPATQALFATLDDEFFDACTAAAGLAVSLEQAERVLGPLQLAASMAPLHEPVHASLIAALIGRSVDLRLLARTAAIEVAACLDRLDPVAELGLLEPAQGDPFSRRFAHDLVREAVVEATPAPRAGRIHLRVADALEDIGRDDELTAERLAHHLWAAGPLADPVRTANALLAASRRSTARLALAAAERQCQLAADVARTAGHPDLELAALSQLTAVVAMGTGFVGLATGMLERAEQLAHRLGRELEAADFLFARWIAHAYSTELDRSGSVARRLLQLGEASDDPVVRAYGLHAWGVHQWALGNIAEAIKYLSQLDATALRPGAGGQPSGLRRDQQLLSPVKLAEVMALHGDLDAARSLLDTVESAAADRPYAIAAWATWASKIAAMAGDPAWALRAAQRGIEADPELTFAFLSTYTRLNLCWAQAMSGPDRARPVAQARELVAGLPLDPPRAGVTSCYELLGEILLEAGLLADAGAALDQAESLRKSRGERQTEGLSLLLRARLLAARGEHAAAVETAERARCLSARRGAHLFARRAERLLQELAGH
ncbi:MAG TPA: BTAD domain-containing putative transcriptional regulator [Trebonia sp.]|nr:BTAD domain-containing putative transcriptional regulator [Trebonia sp.]